MSDVTSSRKMIGTLIFLVIGPLIWTAHLTAIYGGQSALCAFASIPLPAISGWVIGISVVLGAVGLVALIRPGTAYRILTGAQAGGEQWPFLAFVMRALIALSLMAITYAALGAVMLPACGGLR